uniref:Uncharacterized protein n=1 Tax=Oryza rufipogon TaxID=4529 RepID=A0A0E0NHF3_ORYRU
MEAEWRRRARGSRQRSRPRGDAMSASPPTSAAAVAARLRGHGGVRCTVAVTRFVVGSTKPCLGSSLVHVAVFSDGCDESGPTELGRPPWPILRAVGGGRVAEPSRRGGEANPSVDVGAPAGATFLTQTCAVDVVYTHARLGENRGEGDATAAARRPVAEQMAVSARWLSRRSRPTMRSGRKKRHPRRCQRGGHRTPRREVWPRRRYRCQSASASVAVRQRGKKRGIKKERREIKL